MKILFIAFYFEPFKGVGAKRISYWAENIKALNNNVKKVDVITTNKDSNLTMFTSIDNIYNVLPDDSFTSSLFNIDSGGSWMLSLTDFLNKHLLENHYDFAVITGNPFGHFFIQKTFKKHKVKTIIDFRDPLALNPRIKNNFKNIIKKILFSYYEYKFIKWSFATVVVNKYCLNLIPSRKLFKNKFTIIDNGFDEKHLTKVIDRDIINDNLQFIYTGSLFVDRRSSQFVHNILELSNAYINFVGSSFDVVHSRIINHGKKPYLDTLQMISDLDIAIIFSTGYKFESTTKVFDYLALNKIILVVSNIEIKEGALFDILKNYPKVIFTSDSREAVKEALIKIKRYQKNDVSLDSRKYSRNTGLKMFNKLLCG